MTDATAQKDRPNTDAGPQTRKPVNYHKTRQMVFEHALLLMQGVLGRKGSVIDLGAGHCQFSVMAHNMGWKATALDARRERVPDLPDDIRFILGDVDSDDWQASDYDVITCLGLYYHLDQDMQHRLLEKCRGKALILDTHFAHPIGHGPTKYKSWLGETHERNGEIGANYSEAGHLSDEERKAASPLASFGNKASWWQTKDSLVSTLHDFGWPHVWVFDHNEMDRVQRTFFLCYTANEAIAGPGGLRF